MFRLDPVKDKSVVGFSHDRLDVGVYRLWLPEAVGTEHGSAGTYPHGMTWQRDGNTLRQEATVDQVFGPGNVHEVEPGVLECCGVRSRKEKPVPWTSSYRFGEDRVDFTLTVRNPRGETLDKVSGKMCFWFMEGGWWDDSVCWLLTRDGPRTIADLGRAGGLPNTFQAWLLEGETYDNPFTHEFWGINATRAVAPVWVSRCEKAGCSVVVSCEDAYYIHSNAGNPCTDLAMKFGDLAPGQEATCSGCIEFTTRGVDEIFRGMV